MAKSEAGGAYKGGADIKKRVTSEPNFISLYFQLLGRMKLFGNDRYFTQEAAHKQPR